MTTKDRGYISIHRSIMENPLYFVEPFCRSMAWIDLLLLANHKNSSFSIRGNVVVVPRGSLAYSMETLAQRWRWSRNKVKRYLNVLETAQQVKQQKTHLITLITIVNYKKYQDRRTVNDTTDGPQTAHRRTHLNNDNNVNKRGAQNFTNSAPPLTRV